MVETESEETFPSRPLAPGDLVDRVWMNGTITRFDPPMVFVGYRERRPDGKIVARFRDGDGSGIVLVFPRFYRSGSKVRSVALSRVGVPGPAIWPYLRPATPAGTTYEGEPIS